MGCKIQVEVNSDEIGKTERYARIGGNDRKREQIGHMQGIRAGIRRQEERNRICRWRSSVWCGRGEGKIHTNVDEYRLLGWGEICIFCGSVWV
jgi:hypothetical protein